MAFSPRAGIGRRQQHYGPGRWSITGLQPSSLEPGPGHTGTDMPGTAPAAGPSHPPTVLPDPQLQILSWEENNASLSKEVSLCNLVSLTDLSKFTCLKNEGARQHDLKSLFCCNGRPKTTVIISNHAWSFRENEVSSFFAFSIATGCSMLIRSVRFIFEYLKTRKVIIT